MGKGQKKGESQTVSRGHNSKTNIGRPQDDKLETFFMKKLRNGKLQVITAQSQAQIACYNYSDSKSNADDNQSQEKVSYVKKLFQQIDPVRFKILWKGFLMAAEKWEFKQINSIADFPEFLFCDQCDLSYVLYEILHSDIPELTGKSQFHQDELLYFQLLCFATRDQISFRVMRSIQRNLQLFFKMMEQVKTLVAKYSKEIVRDEKNDSNNSEFVINEEVSRNLRKGQIKNTLNKVESEAIQGLIKTKKIQKNDKNDKKRGRPKKNSESREDNILDAVQFEEVSQKLISHIVRAYAYIYPPQIQKKGVQIKNQQEQKFPQKQQVHEE